MRPWSPLFPHFPGLHVEGLLATSEAIQLRVRPVGATACCPHCGRRSRRIHSRYTRRLTAQVCRGGPG